MHVLRHADKQYAHPSGLWVRWPKEVITWLSAVRRVAIFISALNLSGCSALFFLEGISSCRAVSGLTGSARIKKYIAAAIGFLGWLDICNIAKPLASMANISLGRVNHLPETLFQGFALLIFFTETVIYRDYFWASSAF